MILKTVIYKHTTKPAGKAKLPTFSVKMKTFLTLTVFYLIQFAASQSECPQGWTRWLDEKCYSLHASFLTYQAAQQVCATKGGLLATIKEEAQQTFLDNFIHNVSGIEEEVWLGATRVSITEFQWEDGTVLVYSNWAQDSPSEIDGRDCVVMQSRISKLTEAEGKWRDASCNRPNLFVCESEPVWSSEEVRKVLVETRKKLDNLLQEHENLVDHHEDLVAKHEVLDVKHENLIKNPVPIGFLYYEHHGQPSPQALWPVVQWLDVTSTYAGLFFRAVGDGSADFGSVQNENARTLTQALSTQNQTPRSARIVISPGTWSPWLNMGFSTATGSNTNVMQFYVTGGEIRPKNAAIRIWKRIG